MGRPLRHETARTVLYLHSSAGRYGADRQLALLAGGLDPERYRPLVVMPHRGPLVEDLLELGVDTVIGPVAVMRRELLGPRGLMRLSREAGRQRRALAPLRFDLVHANTSAILPVPPRRAAPLVVSVREVYAGWGALWPPYRAVLERADALLCVSEAVREQFGPAAPARVVHDGLAVRHVRAPRATARATLAIAPDAFVVAVLGRITEWKGQALLAAALEQPGLQDAVGLVAGDPWPGQEHRARGLGRLRLLGFQDDLGTVLGAADVVVVPSTRPDPLPNAALEAAAAGACVVAAAHGGLPEIVRHDETGILFEPGDADALARALLDLAHDPGRARRLGVAAARDVPARFAPERLLDAVQAAYDRVRMKSG